MKHILVTASLAMLTALAGCSGAAESLGFGRKAPDEFAVVERPPLSIPPDFELRPPRPGAPRPQEVSMATRANTLLFGAEAAGDASALSETERKLLDSAGSAGAQADIRDIVDREASGKVAGSKPLIEELLWWRKPAPAGTVLDPAAEAERLKDVKEKGEAPNAGPTPVIERRKSGWIGL